jgi:hypothetical protein
MGAYSCGNIAPRPIRSTDLASKLWPPSRRLRDPIDVRGAETLPNPKLHVFPIKEVADLGRRLDNTAAPCSLERY